MDVLKSAIVAQLFDSPPPLPPPAPAPPAPPPYYVEDNVPDILTFLGTTVYGVSFTFAVTDILEQRANRDADEGEYAARPVHMVVGLFVGLLSYASAFLTKAELSGSLHSALSTLAFFCFAKHLMRRVDMPSRRASALITIGALPLLCLSVLEAGRVQVRSARFFFALMLILAAMPLPHLFRFWLPGSAGTMSFDPGGGRLRKRLFFLFFWAFCYVAASTPSRALPRERAGDARQSVVTCFDLVMVYYALDGLWNPGGDH